MMTLTLSGRTITLETPLGVFQPNTTTQLLAQQLVGLEGKTVLDLGCGTGPLAVFAALQGARKVYAVDIMHEACVTARRNAEINGVADRVEVIQGSLFEPLEGLKFDVIIDDVSGIAEDVARVSPWYPEPIPTGGRDGTNPTVIMLHESRRFLNNNGYLLFPVISLSDARKTLSIARSIYQDKFHLIIDRSIPFCDELKAHLDLLEQLREEGIIAFTKIRSRYFWNLAIYKAEA
jgi:SAM-dependent methyltransferase